MSYFIKNTTNDALFNLSNILPNGNLAITNLYVGFPQVTNSPVINFTHDMRIGTTGYRTTANGVDLGNIIPGKGTFYGPVLNTNEVVCFFGVSSQNPEGARFNNNASYDVEIEACYNHVSFIVQGGGGGGGASNNGDNNDGARGGAGGGGGWRSQKRIPISDVGRSFTVTVGADGVCGFSNKYRPGGSTNGGIGGTTTIQSNNTNVFIRANGGNGGKSRDLGEPVSGGNAGTSENNILGGIASTGILLDSNSGQNGGEGPNAGGTLGGDSIYNNASTNGRPFASVKSPNHLGNENALTNNRPGIPGGGTAANVVYNAPGQNIVYNRVDNAFGGGGGGAGSNNSGNSRPGLCGAPGAPGYAVIYKFLS